MSTNFSIPANLEFVDVAHANNLCHRRSTTGYAFLLNFDVISYCSKTQSTTAKSTTEAEFHAALTAAKDAKFLCAVLLEIGYLQNGPTLLYEDNMPAINMINNRIPTERLCHINIQSFANAKDIVILHIPGIFSILGGLSKALGWILYSPHLVV